MYDPLSVEAHLSNPAGRPPELLVISHAQVRSVHRGDPRCARRQPSSSTESGSEVCVSDDDGLHASDTTDVYGRFNPLGLPMSACIGTSETRSSPMTASTSSADSTLGTTTLANAGPPPASIARSPSNHGVPSPFIRTLIAGPQVAQRQGLVRREPSPCRPSRGSIRARRERIASVSRARGQAKRGSSDLPFAPPLLRLFVPRLIGYSFTEFVTVVGGESV